jgi:hypothetical protein
MDDLVPYLRARNEGEYLSPSTQVILGSDIHLDQTDPLQNELAQMQFTEATTLQALGKAIWLQWFAKEWGRRQN